MAYPEANFAGTYEVDDESGDDALEYSDESDVDAEFLGAFIPPIIPAVGSALGNVIGRTFFGQPRRPPLPPVPPLPFFPGRGVDQAVLRTPRGNATINLPEKLVTQEEFKQATDRLQEAINRNTTRLNTTQNDIQGLSQRVGAVTTSTARDIARVRGSVAKIAKSQKAAIAKLRKEQSARDTNNLMVNLMLVQQLRSRLDDHRHTVTTGATETSPATATGSDNNALLFLPLMLMGTQDGASGDNNNMMMMMMMFALQ